MDESTASYLMEEFGYVHPVFETMVRYDPALVDSLVRFRRSVMPSKTEAGGVLPKKVKELIVTAVEVALGRGEKGRSHARKAIRAGATPQEVFEAVALCIYLAGMTCWVDGGMDAVRASEDEYEKMKRGEEFKWTAEVSKSKE
ncbi:MAG: carboxymuconolactone decarboxylase family protein [Candidatus Caldarchaeum sp.]